MVVMAVGRSTCVRVPPSRILDLGAQLGERTVTRFWIKIKLKNKVDVEEEDCLI